MIHIDGQQIAVYAIVGVAAASLVRRLTAQALAFRGKNAASSSPCGGCGGCSAAKAPGGRLPPGTTAKASEQKPVQLVQLQLTAPKRIQRPNAE